MKKNFAHLTVLAALTSLTVWTASVTSAAEKEREYSKPTGFKKALIVIRASWREMKDGVYIDRERAVCEREYEIPVYSHNFEESLYLDPTLSITCETEFLGSKVYAIANAFSTKIGKMPPISHLPQDVEIKEKKVLKFWRKFQGQKMETIGASLFVSIDKPGKESVRTLSPEESASHSKIGNSLPQSITNAVVLLGSHPGGAILGLIQDEKSCYDHQKNESDPACEAREKFSAQIFIEGGK
jgi:hypothetical protein